MKIGQNCPKIKVVPDKILSQKGREVSKMKKNWNEKFAIPGSFDEKP